MLESINNYFGFTEKYEKITTILVKYANEFTQVNFINYGVLLKLCISSRIITGISIVTFLSLFPLSVLASQPQALGITQVERIGSGIPQKVAIQGNYAYLASLGVLAVVSIADPMNPKEVATLDTPGTAQDLVVSGTYAYVVTKKNGVLVVDISDPAHPCEAAIYQPQGTVQHILIKNNLLYITTNYGLEIIDIQNPEIPTLKGTCLLSYGGNSIVLQANYAYIAQLYGDNYLEILDVATPTTPLRVATYSTPIYGMATENKYLYALSSSGCLRILDISNPINPTEITNLQTGNSNYNQPIGLSNHTLYIPSFNYIQVLDVNEPEHPYFKNSITIDQVKNIGFDQKFMYVATANGLMVLDTQTSYGVNTYGSIESGGQVNTVARFQHLILFTKTNTWPYKTYMFNQYYVENPKDLINYPIDIMRKKSVLGNLFITFNYFLCIFSMNNPEIPVYLSTYTSRNANYATGDTEDGFAYIIQNELSRSILETLDIHNPIQPQKLSEIILPRYCNTVAAKSRYVYMCATSSLFIIDLTDPLKPKTVGNFPSAWSGNDIVVRDNYAYIAATDGIYILDVSRPEHLVVVSNYALPGGANSLYLSGSRMYVLTNDSRFLVLDISNPAKLNLLGFFNTPGDARNFVVDGEYVYIADYGTGLIVLKLDPTLADVPATPTPSIQTLTLPGNKPVIAAPIPARVGETVRFYWSTPQPEQVHIDILNSTGERVAELDGNHPGSNLEWHTGTIAPGIYLYRIVLTINGVAQPQPLQKMAIVR